MPYIINAGIDVTAIPSVNGIRLDNTASRADWLEYERQCYAKEMFWLTRKLTHIIRYYCKDESSHDDHKYTWPLDANLAYFPLRHERFIGIAVDWSSVTYMDRAGSDYTVWLMQESLNHPNYVCGMNHDAIYNDPAITSYRLIK